MIRNLQIMNNGDWLGVHDSARICIDKDTASLQPLIIAAWRTNLKRGQGWAYALIATNEEPGELPSPTGFGLVLLRLDRADWKMLRKLRALPVEIVAGLVRKYGSINALLREVPQAKKMLDEPLTAAILLYGV